MLYKCPLARTCSNISSAFTLDVISRLSSTLSARAGDKPRRPPLEDADASSVLARSQSANTRRDDAVDIGDCVRPWRLYLGVYSRTRVAEDVAEDDDGADLVPTSLVYVSSNTTTRRSVLSARRANRAMPSSPTKRDDDDCVATRADASARAQSVNAVMSSRIVDWSDAAIVSRGSAL